MISTIRLVFFTLVLFATTAQAQTSKKPVKKTPSKQIQQKKATERAAAIAKAREDSIAAVQALAFQMAREMYVADSVRRVREEQDALALKKEQEEQARLTSEKTKRTGNREKKTAGAAAEERKVQKVEKKLAEEQKRKELKERRRNQAELDKAEREKKRAKPAEIQVATSGSSAIGGRGIGIGLKGFANSIVNVGEKANNYLKPWIGFGGGLLFNVGLSKHFAVVPEFVFNRTQQKYEGGPGLPSAIAYVDGVQASLPFRYSTGTYGRGFFINLGPFGEYHTGAGTDGSSANIDKYYSYGAALGLGAGIPVGKARITVELRGNYYMGNSEKGFNDSGVHIINPLLAVGYTFYFK